MIVEDNVDLQTYISYILEDQFNTVLLDNGQEALDYLSNGTTCDLILSDLMMPVLNGFELLSHLKAKRSTWHIPIIMLTANAEVNEKLKALRLGVDDYILKPFDKEELVIRITNLLKNQTQRNNISNKVERRKVNTVEFSNEEREWLISFEKYIQKNYPNQILSVPFLAKEFAMSESTLLRQLKKLTGLTPAKYIQEVRLNEARYLLENRIYDTITKVADKVGYSDVRSFSRSFKKRYGKLPSEV